MMTIEDEIKDCNDYQSLETCLHYIEGHDELKELYWELERAKKVMLTKYTNWHRQFIKDLDMTDPEESVPRRE